MRKRFLLIVLLAASCSTPWSFVGAANHPALVEGAQVATFERGRGAERERRVEVRAGAKDFPADSVDDLMPFVKPIDTAEAAIAYAGLVRALGVTDAGAHGIVVRPDASLTGPGGSGRYSVRDAAAWGIPFLPAARPNAGGFEVAHVILLAPAAHHTLPNAPTPWRLVLTREVVFPDGTIRRIEDKTLTNGQDAARFATL